jgi:hypothetical protein
MKCIGREKKKKKENKLFADKKLWMKHSGSRHTHT